MRRLAIVTGIAVVLLAWCAHPVCVPLPDAAVAEAERSRPLAARIERQLHGPVWQRRDGRWHQCKSWISRQLFF
jgi:hypothetical protein